MLTKPPYSCPRGHGLYLSVALNIPSIALSTQDKVAGFAHICGRFNKVSQTTLPTGRAHHTWHQPAPSSTTFDYHPVRWRCIPLFPTVKGGVVVKVQGCASYLYLHPTISDHPFISIRRVSGRRRGRRAVGQNARGKVDAAANKCLLPRDVVPDTARVLGALGSGGEAISQRHEHAVPTLLGLGGGASARV